MAPHRSKVTFCVIAEAVLLLIFGATGGLALQSFQEEPSDTAVMIGEAVVVLKCVVTEISGNIPWFKGEDYIAGDTDRSIKNSPRYGAAILVLFPFNFDDYQTELTYHPDRVSCNKGRVCP